jgi:hypothetical protein
LRELSRGLRRLFLMWHAGNSRQLFMAAAAAISPSRGSTDQL